MATSLMPVRLATPKRLILGTLDRLAPDLYRGWRRPVEHRLMTGRPLAAGTGTGQSVLFFTVHKCASTLMPKILGYLNRRHLGLALADLEAYVAAFHEQRAPALLAERRDSVFRREGLLYVPLRRLYPVPAIEHYRTVLMLRDPRDVLVSHYFSMAYSHALPPTDGRRARFQTARRRFQTMSVDAYCLERVGLWLECYLAYRDGLLGRPGVHLLRYEDMIRAPDRWLDQLAAAFGIMLDAADRAALTAIGGFDETAADDKFQHIRKKQPGDHREKLTPATIAALNDRLAPVLHAFGYGETAG
jgi:hypothetical protein